MAELESFEVAEGDTFGDLLLILTERTYVPDTYIHQTLSHLPGLPLLLFVSQSSDTINLQICRECREAVG
jgi:hypothetical protein